MNRFRVRLTPEAEEDIRNSFEWGDRVWGRPAAEKWVRAIHKAIFGRLTNFPFSCPLAPETADLSFEIRQLLISRYRVLFEIRPMEVVVLHVYGQHSGNLKDDADDAE